MIQNSKTKLDRSGQAVLEYILLLSLVIAGVGVLVGKIRNGTDVFTAKVGLNLRKCSEQDPLRQRYGTNKRSGRNGIRFDASDRRDAVYSVHQVFRTRGCVSIADQTPDCRFQERVSIRTSQGEWSKKYRTRP